jgi:hypothetical protein
MPAQQWLLKFPTRKLRPEMLAALVEGWRYMEPRNYRTFIEAKLERTRCKVVERRAGLILERLRNHEGRFAVC